MTSSTFEELLVSTDTGTPPRLSNLHSRGARNGRTVSVSVTRRIRNRNGFSQWHCNRPSRPRRSPLIDPPRSLFGFSPDQIHCLWSSHRR
jgi:hypothetical protein